MATNAGRLRHPFITGLDFDRVMIILQRERQRMKKTVVGFRHPFANVVMRQMTVIANGHMMVTALLPGIHMLLHDVAVHTRLRIVAQIAGALAVSECESADTQKESHSDRKEQTQVLSPSAPADRFFRLVRSLF